MDDVDQVTSYYMLEHKVCHLLTFLYRMNEIPSTLKVKVSTNVGMPLFILLVLDQSQNHLLLLLVWLTLRLKYLDDV